VDGDVTAGTTRKVIDDENGGQMVELFIFGCFHARIGCEDALGEAVRDVVRPSRKEVGCLGIHAFRSIRDPRLFYIHSRWVDEAAFDKHADLPHTVEFLRRVESLIDHPLDVTRAEMVAESELGDEAGSCCTN
jgi:quinol monooxygenase YgiN